MSFVNTQQSITKFKRIKYFIFCQEKVKATKQSMSDSSNNQMYIPFDIQTHIIGFVRREKCENRESYIEEKHNKKCTVCTCCTRLICPECFWDTIIICAECEIHRCKKCCIHNEDAEFACKICIE